MQSTGTREGQHKLSQSHQLEAALIGERQKFSPSEVELASLKSVSVMAVVITYNSLKWVESALRGLKAQTEVDLRVVVVDNGSQDGCVEAFIAGGEQLKLDAIRLGTNRGYAVACNAGMDHGIKNDCDYILILNPDVELLPGALAEMLLVERAYPRCGPITAIHISRDEPRIESGCLWFMQLSPEFPRQVPSDGVFKRIYQMEYINGSIMLLSRNLIDHVGKFDELFFFYGEDNDYCRRSYLFGFPPTVATQAQGYHWHASQRGLDAFRRSNVRRANYLMILKKPSRPFIVSVGLTFVRFLMDHAKYEKSISEWLQIWKDYLDSMKKIGGAYRSRSRDKEGAPLLIP